MLNQLQRYQSLLLSLFCGAFFVGFLHFKWSYTLFPLLVAVWGLAWLIVQIKRKQFHWDSEQKWITFAFVGYFVLFLISLLINRGRGNELDLPSRGLLMLPVLFLLSVQGVKKSWIFASIIIGALLAGIIGFMQVKVWHLPFAFPAHMRIQSGDVAMSLALFSFALSFYFKANDKKVWQGISLLATVFALVGSVMTGTRGAWLALPLFIFIGWVYRKQFSKAMGLALILLLVGGSFVGGNIIQQRYQLAEKDVQHYLQKGEGNSSLGARFEMWRSATIGISEKPLFGWGIEGAKQLRDQHVKQGVIKKMLGKFDHAHNQFLQDGVVRGLLGIVALLAIFLIPLRSFWQGLKVAPANSNTQLFGVLGVVHIVATMIYCLSQAFLSHNSGIMFYTFVTMLWLALQKKAQNQGLATESSR